MSTTAPRRAQPPLAMLLLLVIILPPFILYEWAGVSLAIGATLAGAFIIVILAAYPLPLVRVWATAGSWTVLALLAITLHLLFAGLLRPIDLPHAFASFVPLLILVLAGVALATAMAASSARQVDAAIRTGCWTLVTIALLPSVGLDIAKVVLPRNGNDASIFPFNEPSHLALIFMPFFVYVCTTAAPRRRLFLLGLGLVIVLAMESLTLAVGWLLVALVCMRGVVLPVAIVAILGVVVTQFDLSYYLSRLDFSGDSQNLSTLVYLQGWELANEAMAETNGWGDGFQQLGLQGTDSPISRLIVDILGGESNIRDGGFTLAKLVGELGVLGMGLAATLFVAIARSVLALRRIIVRPGSLDPALVFAHAVFVGYLVELLLRGVGYFSGTALLLAMAVSLRLRQTTVRRSVALPKSATA